MDLRIALAALLLSLAACTAPQDPAPAATVPASPDTPDTSAALPDSLQNGHHRLRDAQGRLLMEGDMLNGQRHGLWVAYDLSGRVKSRNAYLNGMLDGPSVVFRENGALFYQGQHAQGHPVGTWTFHDEIGTLVRTVVYDSTGVEIKGK
ncbi:MAG: hypothetical protein IT229_02970 [Flavobacteriales bacterium]|nr:hypothetical protein [Flavobacteriales bacterium]